MSSIGLNEQILFHSVSHVLFPLGCLYLLPQLSKWKVHDVRLVVQTCFCYFKSVWGTTSNQQQTSKNSSDLSLLHYCNSSGSFSPPWDLHCNDYQAHHVNGSQKLQTAHYGEITLLSKVILESHRVTNRIKRTAHQQAHGLGSNVFQLSESV